MADDHRKPLLRRAGWILAGVVVLAGFVLFVRWIVGNGSAMPKKTVPEVVQLNLVQPPPPPPPPPPPQQKMVEQPKLREVTPTERPPDDKPPSPKQADTPPQPLALDAQAQGPGDAFALGGRPGGADYLGGGGGGGGGKYGWYKALIQSHIQAQLRQCDPLRRVRYNLPVEVWFDAAGRPGRVELMSSTGEAALDASVRKCLTESEPMPQAPPQDLPQPTVMRVSSS